MILKSYETINHQDSARIAQIIPYYTCNCLLSYTFFIFLIKTFSSFPPPHFHFCPPAHNIQEHSFVTYSHHCRAVSLTFNDQTLSRALLHIHYIGSHPEMYLPDLISMEYFNSSSLIHIFFF